MRPYPYSWTVTHSTQALNADKHKKCYTLHNIGVQKLSYSIRDTFGSTLKIPSDRIHSCPLQRLLHKPINFTYQPSHENLNRTTKEEMRGWHQQSKPNKILKIRKNWTSNIPNAAKTNKKRLIHILLLLCAWRSNKISSCFQF